MLKGNKTLEHYFLKICPKGKSPHRRILKTSGLNTEQSVLLLAKCVHIFHKSGVSRLKRLNSYILSIGHASLVGFQYICMLSVA